MPPRGEKHGPLVESVAGQRMMRFMAEVKVLPASVLNRKLNEKAEHIEKSEGRKPGKKEGSAAHGLYKTRRHAGMHRPADPYPGPRHKCAKPRR